ncbi:Lrp/AsnC family transcriptional regulator [Priestia aryabhattai]|uniref:Lrp/AsnC family transcriptional regulator n=1 Tax=Priestia aryabhattai TaxID=412384 RepID=UPI0032E88907
MEKVKKIKNFLLSKVKSDLSDKAPILSKAQITNVVEYNLHVIDELLLDLEGVTYAEYAPSNKQHKILRSFISALAYQGFTQAKEITLAEKFNVSRPTLRSVIEFLEDLGIIHKLLNRRKAKRAPTVYILVLHPHYLNNLKYFKQNFIEDINVSEIYTSYFTKEFTELFTKTKSQTPCESKSEESKKIPNKVNEVNSSKDNILYRENNISDDQDISFKEYHNEKEKYAAAQGVPTEVINKLNPLHTDQIISVWKSVSRTLSKYGLDPLNYLEQVLESCELAISAYYHHKGKAYKNNQQPQFNFAGCICGKLKKLVYQLLQTKMKQVQLIDNPLMKESAKLILGLTDNDQRAVLNLFREFNPIDKGLDELGVY